MDTQTIHCTIDDAARVIGRHQRTVHRKIRDGKLQAIEGENGKRLVTLEVPRVTSREAMAALETLRLAITQGDDESERKRNQSLIRELQERVTMLHDMRQEIKRELTQVKKRLDACMADAEAKTKALNDSQRNVAAITSSLNSVAKNKAELQQWYERGESAFHKVVAQRETLKRECQALRMEIAAYWSDSEADQAAYIESRWSPMEPMVTTAELERSVAELFPKPKNSTPEELAARLQAIRAAGPRPRSRKEAGDVK